MRKKQDAVPLHIFAVPLSCSSKHVARHPSFHIQGSPPEWRSAAVAAAGSFHKPPGKRESSEPGAMFGKKPVLFSKRIKHKTGEMKLPG